MESLVTVWQGEIGGVILRQLCLEQNRVQSTHNT